MPKYRLLTAAAALAVLAGLTVPAFAQTPAAPAAPAVAATPAASPNLVASGDVASTLRQSAQFTTFVQALDATNLAGLLQNQPNITIFAPTNAAFAALPAGQLDSLMANKPALQKLLLHHLINARVPGAKIKGTRGPRPTGAQDQVVLDGGGDVLKADNATVIQADVTPSNGIIHVVDQVMIAGSVPATLPEPPAAEAAPPPAAPAKVTTTTKTTTKKKK
jgi:uncharacterized surface protein with fasciclin (FAS1) repeats